MSELHCGKGLGKWMTIHWLKQWCLAGQGHGPWVVVPPPKLPLLCQECTTYFVQGKLEPCHLHVTAISPLEPLVRLHFCHCAILLVAARSARPQAHPGLIYPPACVCPQPVHEPFCPPGLLPNTRPSITIGNLHSGIHRRVSLQAVSLPGSCTSWQVNCLKSSSRWMLVLCRLSDGCAWPGILWDLMAWPSFKCAC